MTSLADSAREAVQAAIDDLECINVEDWAADGELPGGFCWVATGPDSNDRTGGVSVSIIDPHGTATESFIVPEPMASPEQAVIELFEESDADQVLSKDMTDELRSILGGHSFEAVCERMAYGNGVVVLRTEILYRSHQIFSFAHTAQVLTTPQGRARASSWRWAGLKVADEQHEAVCAWAQGLKKDASQLMALIDP